MLKRLFCISLGLMLLFLSGCNPAPDSTAGSSASVPSGNSGTTTPTVIPPYTTIPPEERGTVRIYTCDATLYRHYLALADAYTAQNDVEVTVVLGEGDCREALAAEMGSENAPTLLCLHSAEDLTYWQDSLYDLTGAAVISELYSLDFVKRAEDKILAVAADVQGYGLIYNASLLAQAGFTRSDITDFAYLELVCQRISKQKPGFSAFSGLDFSNAVHRDTACMLSGIAGDGEHLKRFLDLYLAHDKESSDPLQQFLDEKSLFYVGGTWDYEAVAALGDNKLELLPAYCTHGGSLKCITELCWGVNSRASDRDIRQTLDFMRWMVMARQDGPAPVDTLGFLAPYRGAGFYANKLEEKLRTYMSQEAVSVDWNCCNSMGQQQLQALNDALALYSKNSTVENWETVENILAGKLPAA